VVSLTRKILGRLKIPERKRNFNSGGHFAWVKKNKSLRRQPKKAEKGGKKNVAAMERPPEFGKVTVDELESQRGKGQRGK